MTPGGSSNSGKQLDGESWARSTVSVPLTTGRISGFDRPGNRAPSAASNDCEPPLRPSAVGSSNGNNSICPFLSSKSTEWRAQVATSRRFAAMARRRRRSAMALSMADALPTITSMSGCSAVFALRVGDRAVWSSRAGAAGDEHLQRHAARNRALAACQYACETCPQAQIRSLIDRINQVARHIVWACCQTAFSVAPIQWPSLASFAVVSVIKS